MATVRDLLIGQSVERIRHILGASPRRFREEMFNRLGIKSKGAAAKGFRLSAKGDARAQRFLEVLGQQDAVPEDVLAEVVRNYLYSRRELLADALDFFDVEHNQGLTDHDLDFLEDLDEEKLRAVEAHLAEQGHDSEDVELYLRFMKMKR